MLERFLQNCILQALVQIHYVCMYVCMEFCNAQVSSYWRHKEISFLNFFLTKREINICEEHAEVISKQRISTTNMCILKIPLFTIRLPT